ncbi:MAG TPA: CDP-alcohol phosphatidyltransferase family protein, partial [Candidatus Saccharimonadales bacterium]|nr:CDP-alcohol phosphatidyltransferase family protein [Candidatus Saccharimonadales bacterium]
MTLHRAEAKPDWERVAKRRRNNWQQLAARTHGWLTPGNVLTFLGAVLVVAGLIMLHSKLYLLSFLLIIVGRLCDLADGWAAHRTGTKSPLGEKLDAGMDKLLGLVALIALVAMHYFPLWAALVIIAVNLAISLPSALSLFEGKTIHPSRAGK